MKHHFTGADEVSRSSSAALTPAQAARPRFSRRYVLEPSRSCSAAPCMVRHGWLTHSPRATAASKCH